MQKIYLLLLFAVATTTLSAQNGLIGGGFAFGFSNPNDINYFDAGPGGSRILITQSTGVGDMYFRMVRAWGGDNSEFGPAATCAAGNDQFVTNDEGNVFQGVPNCGKAFAINVPNQTDFYVFKTPDPVATEQFMFFRLEGAPATVTTMEQLPLAVNGEVGEFQPVMVSASTDVPFPNGQTAYLRYSTDGYASSTVIPTDVTTGASSSVIEATIPGQPDGTTVNYYIFTTGDDVAPLPDGIDADYRTINLNDGGNATYTASRALPVTYAAWAGRRVKADAVRLTWATASEDQASHFAVECSQDGGASWMQRARVPATNRPTGADYLFTDEGTPTGDLQYRLKQTDLDGAFTYSAVITVAGEAAGLEVWPQPAGETLTIDAPAKFAGTTAALTDVSGRVVRTIQLSGGQQSVSVADVAPGVYLLRSGERKVQRVVIR